MKDYLSKSELESYIYKIRNTLCSYNYEQINNVIFFNTEAVYEYLRTIPIIGSETEDVGNALDAIGGCIPVSLNDNSLKFLMQSADSPEHMAALENDFSKKNKMSFLEILTQISSGSEWKKLLNLCEIIRAFRAEEERAIFN